MVNHESSMGRIFEFHSRSVHNFDRLTLMINNMPLYTPEFCGRLRNRAASTNLADQQFQRKSAQTARQQRSDASSDGRTGQTAGAVASEVSFVSPIASPLQLPFSKLSGNLTTLPKTPYFSYCRPSS
jgi:hypothetical protein